MLLINSSVRACSNSALVVKQVEQHLTCDSVTLPPFAPFTGEYIEAIKTVTPCQREFLQALTAQRDHLYIVPTYYKSMPGMFKNYLDLVRLRALYEGKRIGIIASNAKHQDYGARQFMQSLLGLLEFHKAVAVVVPQIFIVNPETLDGTALEEYLEYFEAFPVPGGSS